MTVETARRALAINGGEPVRQTPFPPRVLVTEAERDAVMALFDSAIAASTAIGYAGPEEEAYCEAFAAMLGGGYADAVSSGTAAVYIALRALSLPPGSEVVVPAINDAGGTMPILLAGCVPVIADSAPGSYNAGTEQIAACLSERTSAILLPHIGGEPADVTGIRALADERGVPLVEDCAQAQGASVAGRMLGSIGHLATFSTMHLKHSHTGGQGGVVFTRDPDLYQKVRWHGDRGKPYGLPAGSTNVVAALNFNLDEIHAAIGRVQLGTLSENVAVRRRAAATLIEEVEAATDGAVSSPELVPGAEPSYWFLRLRLALDLLSCTKQDFREALVAEGIPLLFDPMVPHEADWFRGTAPIGARDWPDRGPVSTPHAHQAIAEHFSIAVNGRWTEPEVADTLTALRKVSSAFS